MLCQNCQKKVANVHYTHIVNNQMVEMHLCEQCAKQKSILNISIPLDINSFLGGFMGVPHEVQHPASFCSAACDKCGMMYDEFMRTGNMGCSNCYTLFGNRLIPILKRIQRGVTHTGKVPGKAGEGLKAEREIEKLKQELNAAVQKEEYEKAAELRDKIKEAENRLAHKREEQ
ncbi:MAG: UvrB/UvrC motif-containing protein [Eubacteriales bacterium]|nr:UvrB/UvrC motif-containing protein [Eubacteriales bacterium]